MPRKRNKGLGIVVLLFIAVAFVIVLNFPDVEKKENSVPEESKGILEGEIPVVLDGYKSKFLYDVIKHTPNSRHYSVQQKEGEVTPESALDIVKELYSKEAYADAGGTLGNVVIYDNSVKLTKGESPSGDTIEKAEYLSRDKVIQVGGKSYPFEPARK